jgi:hypothetical protein
VAAVLGTIGSLGLEELISPVPSRQRDLVVAMITAAVIDGSSKLATARGLRAETAASSLGELLGLETCDEDDLYAAMDWLLPRQRSIEDALAARHLRDGTLVLYVVSSAAVEGRTCPLGEIGHARDGVRGRPQIVYGVLTTTAGIPVAVEEFKGSTCDLASWPARSRNSSSGSGWPTSRSPGAGACSPRPGSATTSSPRSWTRSPRCAARRSGR